MSVRSQIGRIGLRARLTLLLAVAMLPLGAAMGWNVVATGQAELLRAQSELARTARLAASTQADLFDGARALLEAARENASVTVAGGDACEREVGQLHAARPQFMTMGVVDAEGMITCHTKLRERLPFGDIPLLKRLLHPGAPPWLVGNFMIGKVTGKPTVAVAMRLGREQGGPGAVFVSIDLERLSRTAEGASDGSRYEVTIVQPSSGRMLTHFPPIPLPFGTALGDTPLTMAMRQDPDGGVVESVGPDGSERVYGFAPVPGAESAGMVLAVGQSKATILADIRAGAVTQLWIAAATFLGALAATWWLGSRTQIRPISEMSRFVRRLERGDLSARVELEDWQAPEHRALAGTMNAAASNLEDLRRKDEAIVASEGRYRMLAENTADLVTALGPDMRRTFVSPASREILGREPARLVGGHPGELAHPDDQEIVTGMLGELRAGIAVGGIRYRMRHADGRHIRVEVSGRPMEGGSGFVMGIRDVSERHAIEQRLEEANRRLAELAATDGLTGIANRRGFDEAFEIELGRAAREATDLGVLMIDVDCFKSFNDLYGHVQGDECLRMVASAIAGALRRPGDTVARYGGEEFAAILPRTGLDGTAKRAEAVNASVRELGLPHAGSPHGFVTVSVGFTSVRRSEIHSATAVIEAADAALYEAKSAGRDRVSGRDLTAPASSSL